MKIFITVGTTQFDRLINTIDKIDSSGNEFVIQTAETSVTKINHKHFKWVDNIDEYFQWADIIICHAGAGTIYTLLEMQKKIIVVPNLDRTDQHQKEIANYFQRNNYGLVCWNLSQIEEQINTIQNTSFNIYNKDPFFQKNQIISFIKEQL